MDLDFTGILLSSQSLSVRHFSSFNVQSVILQSFIHFPSVTFQSCIVLHTCDLVRQCPVLQCTPVTLSDIFPVLHCPVLQLQLSPLPSRRVSLCDRTSRLFVSAVPIHYRLKKVSLGQFFGKMSLRESLHGRINDSPLAVEILSRC